MQINWFCISGDVYVAFLAALRRWSLKIVSPAKTRKLSKAQKLPWFVLEHLPYLGHYHDDHGEQCSGNHKKIISVIEQSSFLLFWMVSLAPSLSWINTLSRLILFLSMKESQTAMASLWHSLAAWISHTSYIFLKLVNAVSTSTFLYIMLQAKSTQGRQYPWFSCQL